MKLVLDNVDLKHRDLLMEMAKALKFKVKEVELTEKEEDQALLLAMEEGKKEGRASREEQDNFETWLKAI